LKSGASPEEQTFYGSFRPTEQVWLAWERTGDIAHILDVPRLHQDIDHRSVLIDRAP
jgi:hypothetical protein